MKANKALVRLARIVDLMSDVTGRGAPDIREKLLMRRLLSLGKQGSELHRSELSAAWTRHSVETRLTGKA